MNNCRLEEIKVDKKNPYCEEILGRKIPGDVLLQLVKSFSEGFVMALNGKWGSGKTTFVNMWQQQMNNEGYETIYYNSWENDYISDPLIGLIAEFKKKTQTGGEKRIEKYTNIVRKISFSMVPSLLALMVKHFTGIPTEDLDKVIKDGSKEAMDLLNKSVDNYIKQQESITEFKKALSEYVNDITPNKPLIFIIDELDRCKPDFAVKTLERIKHLFTVKNVVFVLSIDHEQLCHSVRGYYGSDKIAADDYLRRFIDYQFDLPTGDSDKLIEKVFERFEFDKTIVNDNPENSDYAYYKHFVWLLYTIRRLSIRDLEKWMLYTRLIINHVGHLRISAETLTFLVFLRFFETEFYNHYKISEISDESVLEYLAHNFSAAFFDTGTYSANFTYTVIAELIRLSYWDNLDAFNERVLNKEGDFQIRIPEAINKVWLRDSFHKIRSITPLYNVINCIDEVILSDDL